MIDLKFRMWVGGRMHYWGFIDNAFVGPVGGNGEALDQDEKRERTMQYTGLKDSQGVEIYEGDIIAFGDRVGDTDIEGGVGPVVWGSCGWYVKGFYYGCQDDPCCAFSEKATLEVIGHIYESPTPTESPAQ